MLRNYLKIALRTLRRHPGYTFINIAGLAVGMAVCLLIGLYIQDELSYDDFHEKADRIYRVTLEVSGTKQAAHYAVSVPGLAPALLKEFPAVKRAARIPLGGSKTITVGEQQFQDERFYHADPAIFDIFTIPFLRGNPETALSRPNTVVLTESTAHRYFGTENPLGRTITAAYGSNTVDLEVTGVVEDMPRQSHFHFDLLASYATLAGLYPTLNDQNWWMRSTYTYILLAEQADPAALEDQLPTFVNKYMAELSERSGASYQLHLQPLTAIHLHSHLRQEIEANGRMAYLYIFGAAALLILLIACVNYMNLATARSARRAKEIGIRRVVGAPRAQIIRQFLAESMLLSLLALVLTVVLVQVSMPAFNLLAGKELAVNPFGSLQLWGMAVGIALLVGLLAGSYPAFYLSHFHPAAVLRNTFRTSASGVWLRKGLVVGQFTISIALLVGTIVIYNQLVFMQNKDLGFNGEHVVVLPAHEAMRSRYAAVRQQLLRHPGVESVAAASHVPTKVLTNNTRVIAEGASQETPQAVTWNWIDPHYLPTLDITLAKGRNLSGMRADSSAFLINKTAAQYFGWQDPIGKTFRSINSGEVIGQVVGVVEDFHVQSLHQPIGPMVFSLGAPELLENIIVRIEGGQTASTLSFLEETWQTFAPGQPFEYFFLDERYDALYQAEQRLATIFGVFAGLAIFIACLGLFGLAAYMAEQRTKEIGIRKVLGATVPGIVALLSRDFLKLVGIAILIASPIAYVAMEWWLQDFAYRIELGPGVFLLAGAIAVVIALLTIGYQSIKAALANPVDSLRYE